MEWTLDTPTTIIVLSVYFAVMVALTVRLSPGTSAESFVVADRDVGYRWGAASMSATWIWAASMFAAATAGYRYGVSGAFHYAFWGGLGLLFVWRYGLRVRQLVPFGHTLPEFIRARHGRLSQAVVGAENYVNSQYSLVLNVTAGSTLLALFTPLSYEMSLVVLAAIVLGYAVLSGIQASVVTDVVQVAAMVLVAAIAVPLIFANAGGPSTFSAALDGLGPQGSFFSLDAFLGQGAPMMALILAYAFANPTVWQRIWTVRLSDLGRIYRTSAVVYIALVLAVGSLGFVALVTGIQPVDGDLNTLVPLVAQTYLPTALAIPFLLLVLAAITSTSDSDLAALSSMTMNDVWRGYVRPDAGDAELKAVGRWSMLLFSVIAVAVAAFRIDILTLILVYGMIRAASVFPIAASIVWDRVSNVGFAAGTLAGIVFGLLSRWLSTPGTDGASWLSANLTVGALFVVVSSVGAGTMAGCLAYPFTRVRWSLGLGVGVAVVVLGLQLGNLPGLLTYNSLLSTLTALGVGMLVTVAVSLAQGRTFEWADLDRQVTPMGAVVEAR